MRRGVKAYLGHVAFLACALLALAVTVSMWAQSVAIFEYPVTLSKPLSHVKLQRDVPGVLQFSQAGILFKSNDGKTTVSLDYADVKKADVSDPDKISIETYDIRALNPLERHAYEFKLKKAHGPDLVPFLVEHIQRPVIGDSGGSDFTFRVPAYHRHITGGAHGILEIGSAGIRFVSKAKADSRTWLYRDIDTIGSSGPFNFRVTTPVETYNFDLKERLPEGAYDLAWRYTYNLGALNESAATQRNAIP